jgi:hypothetical protein
VTDPRFKLASLSAASCHLPADRPDEVVSAQLMMM